MNIHTQILTPSTKDLEHAARIIQSGGLVSFPTETVYGLGANAYNDTAVKKVFCVKGRPSTNPLIIHVESYSKAAQIVQFNQATHILAMRYWPGALTLILPKADSVNIPSRVSSNSDFLAVRVPANAITLRFICHCGVPLVGPSANQSGRVSPTHPQHVLQDLHGKIDAVIDGGQCEHGVESTVLTYYQGHFRLLRHGSIPVEEIQKDTGIEIDLSFHSTNVLSPGTLAKHYSPKTPLRLNANRFKEGELFVAFGQTKGKNSFNLSESGCLKEAAKNLFAILRDADQAAISQEYTMIAIAPIPNSGLGITINDRLRRASMAG